MKRFYLLSLGFLLLIAARSVLGLPGDPSPDVVAVPPRDSFIIVPLHIHVLSCEDRADLDCKMDDDAVRRVIGKVNGIWHKAGVHFHLEPILHEKAANVKEFSAKSPDAKDPLPPESLGAYRTLAPPASRALHGLHVYYIHEFSVNGVFLGGGICFVKDTARLRAVEGGIDEPLPRVTAHELGHAMGLPHRQAVTNLMASGTTGTKLNQAEIAIVQAKAVKIAGARTAQEVLAQLKIAEAKNDRAATEALQHELGELPGD